MPTDIPIAITSDFPTAILNDFITIKPTQSPIVIRSEPTPQNTQTYRFETCVSSTFIINDVSIAISKSSNYHQMMKISISGPRDKWFVVGFGGIDNKMQGIFFLTYISKKINNFFFLDSYAITVEGRYGDVFERILESSSSYNKLGSIVSPPSYYPNDIFVSELGNKRYVTIIRPWHTQNTFDFSPFFECQMESINIIAAIGYDLNINIHQITGSTDLITNCKCSISQPYPITTTQLLTSTTTFSQSECNNPQLQSCTCFISETECLFATQIGRTDCQWVQFLNKCVGILATTFNTNSYPPTSFPTAEPTDIPFTISGNIDSNIINPTAHPTPHPILLNNCNNFETQACGCWTSEFDCTTAIIEGERTDCRWINILNTCVSIITQLIPTSVGPTVELTDFPTIHPTKVPTTQPTPEPTKTPSNEPTNITSNKTCNINKILWISQTPLEFNRYSIQQRFFSDWINEIYNLNINENIINFTYIQWSNDLNMKYLLNTPNYELINNTISYPTSDSIVNTILSATHMNKYNLSSIRYNIDQYLLTHFGLHYTEKQYKNIIFAPLLFDALSDSIHYVFICVALSIVL